MLHGVKKDSTWPIRSTLRWGTKKKMKEKKQLMTAIKTKIYTAETCLKKYPRNAYILVDTSKFLY